MVPPTGVSDSILVVRRNGASVEPTYGALSPQLKNYSMESTDGRGRKNWGEKWKNNKPGKSPTESQMIETSGFMVHPDYLNKYGTLSNGVLTKSIKYAETWLYGTVGVRGAPNQRPSLFLYPGVVAPGSRIVNQSNYLSSPSAYVGVPVASFPSSERGPYVLSQPRKVNGKLKELQYHKCNDCGKDIRPGTGSLCKKCGDKRNGTLKSTLTNKSRASLKDTLRTRDKKLSQGSIPDPYNLMRKSRLGVGESSESSIFNVEQSQKKKRNASASPLRRQNREASGSSFETFKPKQSEKELWKNNEDEWISGEEEIVRRKSILECDINAYELNKNRNKLKDTGDSSDEFSESSVIVDTKIKILRPKLNKTELRKIPNGKLESEGNKNNNEASRTSEVRLNGQRFKIFDHSSPSTSTVEGYVSDDEDRQTNSTSEPRPASPKRPPRRPKDKVLGDLGFKYSKSRSKSSPNLSIKSILKKPTGGDDCSLLDVPFSSEESPTSSDPFQFENASKQSALTIKKQSQSTLKKKKQVQFKVNNSYESLHQTNQTPSETVKEEGEDEENSFDNPHPLKAVEAVEEPLYRSLRSQSCENLSLAAKVVNGNISGSEESESNERKEAPEQDRRDLHTEDESISHENSNLKRSLSERRATSSPVISKDDLFSLSSSPPNSNLFNDTMALRTRSNRLDTRGVFVNEKKEQNKKKSEPEEKPKLKAESKSVVKTSTLSGNLISYAEFSERIDAPSNKKGSLSSSSTNTISKKSKLPVTVSKKSPAPNPPPRQPPASKTTKTKNSKSAKIVVTTKDSSLEVPNGVLENDNQEPKKQQPQSVSRVDMETENGKVLLRLTSAQDNDNRESVLDKENRASITIQTSTTTVAPNETKSFPQRKTSVLINNFDPMDSNKVTISVRNDPPDEQPSSSTCTIIETGSNSTVIPVVSTDNKTTLIVGSNTPMASPEILENSEPPLPPQQAKEEISQPEKPLSYIFSTVNLEATDPVELMDPVEAVRRNLVPHICGKEESGLTLMEKIKQSRETKEQKSLKLISQLFDNGEEAENCTAVAQPPQFLLNSFRNKKGNWKASAANSKEEDSSTTTSRSNSFCSTVNSSIKNSSTNTSRSSSFRSNCQKSTDSDYDGSQIIPFSIPGNKFYVLSDAEETSGQEKDKLECEYEIRNGFKDEKKEDGENIYETIKEEPIYDQIQSKEEVEESEDDIPPPLPLTLPPSLDEVEKRSMKSMFEGASKYEILNYLVDAKDRVQEESYYSGSSASELNSLDGSEKASLNGRMLPSSKPVDMERQTSKNDKFKTGSVENDSGIDLSRRISHMSQTSFSSDDYSALTTPPERESLKLTRKSSAEIERNDSGVGSETSHTSRSKWQAASNFKEDPQHLCEDCDQNVETQVTEGGVVYAPLVCRKCSKRRSERKEIIQEIVDTEEKYGRDLKIILEEFYTPMLVAGLLTSDQLSAIFLNTEELLENSEQLTEKLRDTLDIALEQGDEDLLTVNIGKLFLEAGPMLHAFESYCTRQGAAAVLLANLEKEKELLRIFLRVSQMENAVLRRMNLNSFLMVPVQRVTKYPLLLARLYKVTPPQQEGRELLKEAQHNIELHLEHMNSEAKDASATKVWRRFSTSTVSGRKSTAELEMINIKLRKMAVDVLEWNHEEVRFVMEGKLLYTQPTDNNWKRGRTIKLNPIFVLLVTLGKPNSKYKMDPPEDQLTFPTKTGVREATLLLVKEKCGRYTLIREPLYLDKIIVCCETDADEFFEVQELLTKDSFIFKAEDGERTKEWYRHLQYHAQILGSWRRRRNALANIMINGMMARAYTS